MSGTRVVLDINRGSYPVRKESRTLHAKAVDSLVLAVDHFNRAWDRGRTEAVLILLDRSFELLLKAIIVHRAGGSAIREPGKQGMTLGFDHCLRKCLSDAKLKCLDEDDAVALQALNTLGMQHSTTWLRWPRITFTSTLNRR
jgi:hypothetical protein